MLVRDVFTIIDLEQGASENFKKLGYNLHSLIKMSRVRSKVLTLNKKLFPILFTK